MTRHHPIATSWLLTTVILLSPVASQDVRQPSSGPERESTTADVPAAGPPAPEPQAPVPAGTAPTLTLANLASEIDTALARLRDIGTRTRRQRVAEEIESKLAETELRIEALRAERESLDLETLSLHVFEELREQVARFDSRIAEWKARLDARAAELSKAAATVGELREHWISVRESVRHDETPATLRQQMQEVETAIAGTRERVEARLDALAVLRGRVGAAYTELEDLRAEIETARDRARGRLFVPESPALWQMIGARGTASFREQFQQEWDRDRRGFEEFVVEYGRRLAFQLALFAALAFVLVALRRRGRSWGPAADDDSGAPALRILSRPVSAALLVTLLFTRAFYPHAPPVIYDTNGLLGLVPLLRLIPRLVHARIRPAIYAVGGLYALQMLREFVPPQTLLDRLLLLVLSGLALGLALWVVRPSGAASRGSGQRRWTVVAAIIRLGALALTLSVLANVLGAVSLADLWTTTILLSAYLGIGIFAGVLILDMLVTTGLRSRWAHATGMVARHGELIRERLTRVLRAIGILVWLWGTLRWLGRLEPLLDGLAVALGTRWSLGNVDVSLGDVVAFAASIYASVLVSRFVRFVLQEDVYPRVSLPRGVPATLSMLINYGILALGFLFAVSAAGIGISQFTIVLGALGVGIGFGLQNVVNNFISGLILVFERPIKIGDTIEVGPLTGEVRRIGIRSSTVRTYDGAEVIVPNGDLVANEVINWTLSDRIRRIKLPIGVAYGTDPQRVLDVLEQATAAHEDVLGQPRPSALFKGFGDSSLDFEIRFWTASFETWPIVRSQVAVRVNAALRQAGIEIPFPQRDLHLRSVDPSASRALAGTAEPAPSLESGGEEH